MVPAEPFAEIPQPRGEHGLVSGWSVAIRLFARVVGHAFDTREVSGDRGFTAAPKARGPYGLGPIKSRIGPCKLSL